MSGTHAAAGVFSVAAVELLHNIPAFNHLAEGSKGGLRVIASGVVAQVDENLRGARSRAGVGKGNIAGCVVDLERVIRNGFMTPSLRDPGIAGDAKLDSPPRNHAEEARVVVIMLADQLVKTVSAFRRPVAVCLDHEASSGCVDSRPEDAGCMRRMERRKSQQDREQKHHPVQCSATVFETAGETTGASAQPMPIA